jgi:hypothetical protein
MQRATSDHNELLLLLVLKVTPITAGLGKKEEKQERPHHDTQQSVLRYGRNFR